MVLLGWDIGGTKCAAVLGEYDGKNIEIKDKKAFATPRGPEAALEALAEASLELGRGKTIDAVGISCGGPLDTDRGIIMSPPNLPGWDDVHICEYVRGRLGVPAYLENDANACALAEWRFGAGRGSHSCVFLTFGTGLGAGVIVMNRLWRGANGNAGECGHMRLAGYGPAGYGKNGSFEGFCSGGGIAQLAESVGRAYIQSGKGVPGYPVPGASAKDVAEASANGDACAMQVMDICGRKLGEGLAVLVDILNPETIVIGSIYARCHELLDRGMYEALNAEALGQSLAAVKIVPAGLGESIGDIAALCSAVYGCETR